LSGLELLCRVRLSLGCGGGVGAMFEMDVKHQHVLESSWHVPYDMP
jgi:hypothetical protein